MSRISIFVGDAAKLPVESNSVDLIITHPPYFGLDTRRYGGDDSVQTYNSKRTQKKFFKLMVKATKEMYRVLKPSGHLLVAASPFDGLDSKYVTKVLENTDFQFLDRVFQNSYNDKSIFPDGRPDGIASNAVTVWSHFIKTEDFYYNHIECKRYNNAVWDMNFSNLDDPVDIELQNDYPVQDTMNKELVVRFIKMFSKPNHVVLDPFAGTGLVPVTAAELGRYGILNDISEKQIEGAQKRIALTFGDKNV